MGIETRVVGMEGNAGRVLSGVAQHGLKNWRDTSGQAKA